MTKKYKNISILAHLIFGLPNETIEDMKKSVKMLVELGVEAFKLHHLYIEKGTAAERMYKENKLKTIGLDEYIDIIAEILPIIPKNIVIHRLFGSCASKTLLSPLWTLDKQRVINLLNKTLEERDIIQGCSL